MNPKQKEGKWVQPKRTFPRSPSVRVLEKEAIDGGLEFIVGEQLGLGQGQTREWVRSRVAQVPTGGHAVDNVAGGEEDRVAHDLACEGVSVPLYLLHQHSHVGVAERRSTRVGVVVVVVVGVAGAAGLFSVGAWNAGVRERRK